MKYKMIMIAVLSVITGMYIFAGYKGEDIMVSSSSKNLAGNNVSLSGSGSYSKNEMIYGSMGDVICNIKRKYDSSNNIIKEKMTIYSDEYDKMNLPKTLKNIIKKTKYPVKDVIKYTYDGNIRKSGIRYRNGEKIDSWKYDSDGNEIRKAVIKGSFGDPVNDGAIPPAG